MTSVLEERAYWLKRCLLLEQQLERMREERDAAREVAALYRHKLWREREKRRAASRRARSEETGPRSSADAAVIETPT